MKITILLGILGLCISLLAQSQTRNYETKRFNGAEPKIDGQFNDEAWDAVNWSGNFTQNDPNNGAPASQKTQFKILYNDHFIYVAIKAFDTEPGLIDSKISRRDDWEGDLVALGFDSYFDKQTCFVFAVSAAGVKNDGVIYNDSQEPDNSPNPIWFVKTQVVHDGWNAEIKIPLSQLRYGSQDELTWGLQVVRSIYRNQEFDTWQHVSNDISGWVSRFGTMSGLKSLKSKRQIEIAPYTMAGLKKYEKEEGNPYADGSDPEYQAGIDGKIGITNDLTLNFTVNPDFGQVEADPSEVNLTAFESYFEEKRPFFIEGSNITNYQITAGGSPWSSDNLFYSRRIGRTPHYYPDVEDGEYLKMPDKTRILGAVKLTGKTQSGWSVGVIESLAAREKAKITSGSEEYSQTVEPLSNYFLARLQKDLNQGNTLIGGMLTSTRRFINDDELLFMNKSAISGGLDFMQYFKDRKYFILVKLLGSKISGDKEAILDQQLSSRRYFQRPDADYLILDSNRTSLSGHAGTLLLGKNGNSGFRYAFNLTWRSPGFELNDLGYLRKANSIFHYYWLGYQFPKPFSIFRAFNINLNEWAGWDFAGNNTFFGGNISTWMQFNNLWSFNINFSREGQNIDDAALRGGPALYTPGNWNFNMGIHTSGTKKLQIGFFTWANKNDKNSGKSHGISSFVNIKPNNKLSFALSPDYNYSSSDLQYISTEEYLFEDRYLFASIQQKTLTLTIRANYYINPDLSIQYYGSPFVSSGLYDDFKRISDPKAEEYADRFRIYPQSYMMYFVEDEQYGISENGNGFYNYYIDQPDFNFRQFRSNLVIRWEFRPGSLLYVVWSQDRTDYISNGNFDYWNDLGDLFKITPDDVFMIKLSYLITN